MIRNCPFLQQGDKLFLHIMKVDPACAMKTTVAQQLAEQAADKTTRTWDQIVPTHYHTHTKVFSEDAAQQFPESCEWDHAIDLKLNALNSLDCKVYPLSLNKDTTLVTCSRNAYCQVTTVRTIIRDSECSSRVSPQDRGSQVEEQRQVHLQLVLVQKRTCLEFLRCRIGRLYT